MFFLLEALTPKMTLIPEYSWRRRAGGLAS
jgi:hypothetical protein